MTKMVLRLILICDDEEIANAKGPAEAVKIPREGENIIEEGVEYTVSKVVHEFTAETNGRRNGAENVQIVRLMLIQLTGNRNKTEKTE